MTVNGNTPLVLDARGISKTFGERTVLRELDLSLAAGEVHGLLGENGSGKSTLIKVLAGFHAPDPGGELWMHGEPVRLPLKVTDPPKLGIGFVHQDLPLFDSGTILENVRVGRYATRSGWRIPWRDERRVVAAALAGFGLDLDPDTQVSRLSAIERAMVAIVRALDQVSGSEQAVLVLDEPTAYLPNDGVERLFAAVREVGARGIGIVFVTHRLEEISEITDRVTVLRDGARVLTTATEGLTQDRLIEAILGFELAELYPEQHPSTGRPLLEATGVGGDAVSDVALGVGEGEIVGVTGLVGMGFDELPYLLFGAAPEARGVMTMGGRHHDLAALTPRAAMDAGLALVPANRPRDGAVGDASLAENLTLLRVRSHYRGGRLRHGDERREAVGLMDEFDIRPRDPVQRFGVFSGGNQQKALLAKWLTLRPRVLLLHEPTQGVDIGARRDLFAKIRAAADAGTGILIASAEYEDLSQLCDRVLVVRHGRIVSELRGKSLTPDRVLDQVLRRSEVQTPSTDGGL
jgi:ribose transport system ATP-binding protein